MSMLAEPRRKQKWSLNPRGKEWSDDSNKFGQKMLEKMGWTSGKGLGAKEQGMTEHVRVSLKTDTAGIGYKNDDLDKAWTETQDGFNDFLQQLHKSQNGIEEKPVEVKSEPLSGKSLELRSQQSRARVHYRKFTRGKDVNRYSSKDLANIFGKKDLITSTIKEEETNDTENSDPVGSQENTGGVITINGGNMAEYFLKKGKGFAKAQASKTDSQSNDVESENEYVGFGFVSSNAKKHNTETELPCNYAFENPCLRLHSPQKDEDTSTDCTPRKRKKGSAGSNELNLNNHAKKLKVDSTGENDCTQGFVNVALNLDSQSDEVCNGKEFEVSRAQFGLANSGLDLADETEDKKRVTFNDLVEYSTDATKKKKKGKSMLDRFEVENTKHKRKRKHDASQSNSVSGFVNEALDVEDVSEEINDNEVNERKSKKSKKRKESRRSNLETIVEAPEEEKEICERGIDVVILEDDILETNVPEENSSNKEMKKKKKKKQDKVKEGTVMERKDTVVGNKIEEAKDVKVKIEEELDSTKTEEVYQKCSKESKKKKNKNKNNPDSELRNEENVTVSFEMKDKLDDASKELEEQEGKISNSKKGKKIKKKKNTHTSGTEIETKVQEGKEVSDKENSSREDAPGKVKKPKRNKKRRKTIEQITLDDDDNSTQNSEPLNHQPNQNQPKPTVTPSKKNENQTLHVSRSPWNEKARMSKKLLKSLFNRNSVLHFPGSNMHEIKGYGVDLE